ncbi:MAG: type II toxin-antitoxin system HipA family toxin YjjJ [Rhodocyclaceae bacterium]|nr:type II toxin-antitoxin system HipA family toxin YjjJ [Rhodocyclaceae bacterium]
MLTHVDAVRRRLAQGPQSGRQLFEGIGVSQPTGSRTLTAMSAEIVRIGAARSIRYALRDRARGLPDITVHRVDPEGRIRQIGTLVPVRPDGFVMHEAGGKTLHSEGLPWWLSDLRPQGYLGRSYAQRHGMPLGLPDRLSDWTDTHTLRALLVHGHDMVGDLLLGDLAKEAFLTQWPPIPIGEREKGDRYQRLALDAASGDRPGSSAAGEQPKFTAFAATPEGARHVIVKFSEAEAGPVSERWRDLLLAEHLALDTLRGAGVPASVSRVLDHGDQRFLEVQRFDREGESGRRGVISLAALDHEFIGAANGAWPAIVRRLAGLRHIRHDAAETACLLWAFGMLIGNSDMHGGNLSFLSEQGRPYAIAPAYDMTPMCFAPRSGGGLLDTVPAVRFGEEVSHETWRQAGQLAHVFLQRLANANGLSQRFGACVSALEAHLRKAAVSIARMS